MPFLYSLRRAALPAAILFTTIASAQQCYYPDGKTLATSDTPCDTTATVSACCPSDSFCLSGGLCVAGGIISRGSCTDETWGSAACAGYCKTGMARSTAVDWKAVADNTAFAEGANAAVAITPCSTDTDSNTFACGLSGDCSKDTFTLPADTSLALRPSQIAALVGSLISSSAAPSATVCADTDGMVSVGALAGVGVGVGIPLLIALLICILMLRREKRRFSKPKLMYKLPDECREEFTYRAPPPRHPALRADSSAADDASAYSSRRGSFRTNTASPGFRSAAASPGLSPGPRPMPSSFMERYESMKKNVHGQTHESAPRHELDSTPPYQEIERHEMGDYRRSTSSATFGPERSQR